MVRHRMRYTPFTITEKGQIEVVHAEVISPMEEVVCRYHGPC